MRMREALEKIGGVDLEIMLEADAETMARRMRNTARAALAEPEAPCQKCAEKGELLAAYRGLIGLVRAKLEEYAPNDTLRLLDLANFIDAHIEELRAERSRLKAEIGERCQNHRDALDLNPLTDAKLQKLIDNLYAPTQSHQIAMELQKTRSENASLTRERDEAREVLRPLADWIHKHPEFKGGAFSWVPEYEVGDIEFAVFQRAAAILDAGEERN